MCSFLFGSLLNSLYCYSLSFTSHILLCKWSGGCNWTKNHELVVWQSCIIGELGEYLQIIYFRNCCYALAKLDGRNSDTCGSGTPSQWRHSKSFQIVFFISQLFLYTISTGCCVVPAATNFRKFTSWSNKYVHRILRKSCCYIRTITLVTFSSSFIFKKLVFIMNVCGISKFETLIVECGLFIV
jgi:hypothetical protein